jgi:hypothetical protein
MQNDRDTTPTSSYLKFATSIRTRNSSMLTRWRSMRRGESQIRNTSCLTDFRGVISVLDIWNCP